MSTKPAVSIIMPAYNAEKTIAESIQSVLNQTFRDWELIIINDGSVDKTSAIVQNYKDPRIILLEQQNSGVAEARNNGIKNASGKMIAFLDSDDLWLATKLEKFMSYVDQCNFIGLMYSKMRFFNDNLENSVAYNPWEAFDESNPYYHLLLVDYVPTLTVMVNKEIFDDVGLFDKTFFGTEDWDMWIRIVHKYPIALIDEELSLYRNHASGISKKFDRQHHQEYQVMQKHLLHNSEINSLLKKKALWVWLSRDFIYQLQNYHFYYALKIYVKMFKLLPLSNIHFRFPISLLKSYTKRFIKSK